MPLGGKSGKEKSQMATLSVLTAFFPLKTASFQRFEDMRLTTFSARLTTFMQLTSRKGLRGRAGASLKEASLQAVMMWLAGGTQGGGEQGTPLSHLLRKRKHLILGCERRHGYPTDFPCLHGPGHMSRNSHSGGMGRYPTVENSWGRGESLCLMAFCRYLLSETLCGL